MCHPSIQGFATAVWSTVRIHQTACPARPLASEVYSFRIRQTDMNTSTDTVALRIDIDSWFLRLFTPYLEVEYDLRNVHLLRYRGPSNLLRPDREAQIVTIEYRYPETVALNRRIPAQ